MIAVVNNTTNALTSDFAKGLSDLNVVFILQLFNGYIILEVDAKCLRYIGILKVLLVRLPMSKISEGF